MENTDLCKKCEHYWQDFPMPLDGYISHCEELDKKPHKGEMDDIVPYPCTECPFNAYTPKK